MSRIQARFAALKTEGKKALIPYVTAGDPEPSVTVPLMHKMVAAGADIIELGVPFSDPMAEGPVIQKAMERALTHDVTLTEVLGMVKTFRQQDDATPVLLMGYANPIEVMGYRHFANDAAEAGVDGVLIVDMPPEEAVELLSETQVHGLDVVFLVSPTTTDERIQLVSQAGGGFVYYVSLKGVTGAGHLDVHEVAQKVTNIKRFAQLPVCVGFGIRDAESAAQIAAVADGVVVGSALVKKVQENLGQTDKIEQAIVSLLSEMRKAMDREKA